MLCTPDVFCTLLPFYPMTIAVESEVAFRADIRGSTWIFPSPHFAVLIYIINDRPILQWFVCISVQWFVCMSVQWFVCMSVQYVCPVVCLYVCPVVCV